MNLTEHLKNNKVQKRATLATNFYNFETLKAVCSAAEAQKAPLILQVSESTVSYLGLGMILAMAHTAKQEYDTPMWLHLDHGSDLGLIKKCIDSGFDSVMIDASEKPFSENVKITNFVIDYAKGTEINIEAELGYVAKLGQSQTMEYTTVDQATAFYTETQVPALAIAVGTAHGFYTQTPQLQLDLIEQINQALPAALVLHGSSGVPDDQLQQAIKNGITKVNLATEIKNEFMKKLKNVLSQTNEIDLRRVFPMATDASRQLVENKLKLMQP